MRKLKVEELNRLSLDAYKEVGKLPLVLVVDNVRSLYNVGSLFRTADAFRMERIVLCGISGTPPHAELHKTALGAEDSVQWTYYSDTLEAIKALRAEGYKIIGVEQVEHSVKLDAFRCVPDEKYAFVLGNEVKGVQQSVIDLCDVCVEIPQYGTKHSLNVAVSGGIVMWHLAMGMIEVLKS